MKDKVLIGFFGTVSRSIKYTYDSIKSNLIDEVNKHFDTEIYVFNNNVENSKIDGCIQNNNDVNILKHTYIEEKTQKEIDAEIAKERDKYNIILQICKRYSRHMTQNCLRQMYSEEQIGNFIEKNINKYKCVIVCGPDYYLIKKININHIRNIINKTVKIYTTNVNDCRGYTNGFYIGQPHYLVTGLKRFSVLQKMLPINANYEYILKYVIKTNGIQRGITDMRFLKIRSSGMISFQGGIMKKYKNTELHTQIVKYINGKNNFLAFFNPILKGPMFIRERGSRSVYFIKNEKIFHLSSFTLCGNSLVKKVKWVSKGFLAGFGLGNTGQLEPKFTCDMLNNF